MDIDAQEKHIRRLMGEVESLQLRLAVYEPMLAVMLPKWLEYQAAKQDGAADDEKDANGAGGDGDADLNGDNPPASDPVPGDAPVPPVNGEIIQGQAPETPADLPPAADVGDQPAPAVADEPESADAPQADQAPDPAPEAAEQPEDQAPEEPRDPPPAAA
jgi:hypothetical protein